MNVLKTNNFIVRNENIFYSATIINSRYLLEKKNDFFTQKRSKLRELSDENMKIIETWYDNNEITINSNANTNERIIKVKILTYIWKKCFAITLKDIKITNLIEHFIDLISNAKSIRETLFKYMSQKRNFANRIFSKLKNVDIIIKKFNSWEIKSKLSFKKKNSKLLKMIHNFMSIKRYTIKSNYLMHHMNEIWIILLKFKFRVHFCSNVANEYWVISMKKNDENKTRFIASNEQWIYLKMRQKLKESSFIYAQFSDLMFEFLSSNETNIIRMFTIINDHDDTTFVVFMNNHDVSTTNFDNLFDFLHRKYFLKCIFQFVYLSNHKIHLFFDEIELLRFERNAEKLRSTRKT